MNMKDNELEEDAEKFELHVAADNGNLKAVKEYLALEYSPNVFDEIGRTPLHYATRNEFFEIAEVLIQNGADINAHDEKTIGHTPIADIAGRCSLKMIQFLIKHGANPNIRGWMRLSALETAAENKSEDKWRIHDCLKTAAGKYPMEDIFN